MTKESDKDIVDTLYSSYELILKIKDQFRHKAVKYF